MARDRGNIISVRGCEDQIPLLRRKLGSLQAGMHYASRTSVAYTSYSLEQDILVHAFGLTYVRCSHWYVCMYVCISADLVNINYACWYSQFQLSSLKFLALLTLVGIAHYQWRSSLTKSIDSLYLYSGGSLPLGGGKARGEE